MKDAKILVIGHEDKDMARLQSLLKDKGCVLLSLQKEKEVVRQAIERSVDLIILYSESDNDKSLEICRKLKEVKESQRIPVLVLWPKNSSCQQEQIFDTGADDCIGVPFEGLELETKVFIWLRNKFYYDQVLTDVAEDFYKLNSEMNRLVSETVFLKEQLKKKNEALEKTLKEVERLAVTDPLTNLFNRRRFESIVIAEFRRTARYGGALSCIMMDIDWFKKVNDRYGHGQGDIILKGLAGVIRENIRGVDTAARWGGDEFVILLPETKKTDALVPAKRVLEKAQKLTIEQISDLKISVSIGIAGLPDMDIDSAEDLLHTADQSMYKSKKKGRNCITVSG